MTHTPTSTKADSSVPFATLFEELEPDPQDQPQGSTRMENPDTSTYRRDTDDHDT